MRQTGLLLFAVIFIAGCSSSDIRVAHTVGLVPATETIPEEELLDVSVVLFNPGVPEGEIDKEVLEELSARRYLRSHSTLGISLHGGAFT